MKEQDGLFIYDNWHEAQSARLKAWEGPHSEAFPLSFYSNELVGEIGEACNIIKKLHREEAGVPGSRDTVKHLSEELSDCLICTRNLWIKSGVELNPELMRYDLHDMKSLSDWGTELGRCVGSVCEMVQMKMFQTTDTIFKTHVENRLAIRLSMLERVICTLASFNGIDLVAVYQEKWNDTSSKHGFPHRMKLFHTLEETFS